MSFFSKGRLSRLAWAYIAFFCFLLLLFTGFFYLHSLLLAKIGDYGRLAAKNGIILQGLDLSLLPPGLKIARASANFKNGGLDFTNLEIVPLYSPPALEIKGHLSGGSLEARLLLSSFFRPKISEAAFEARGLALKKLATLFGDELAMIRITEGKASLSGKLAGARNWKEPEGKIGIVLNNGGFTTDLPILKKKSFTDVAGQANLTVAGRRCVIDDCVLRSGRDVLSMRGSIDGWQKPPAARLEIDLELRIDPAEIEEGLLPAKLMANIRKNGAISAHIGQTLANPRLKLEK